jgi:hypothetical protein
LRDRTVRKFTGGNGADTTAAVNAWIRSHANIITADLYLIGELEDPQAVFVTNFETPLLWSQWGTFLSTDISRGKVTSKIGLEVTSLPIEWKPQVGAFTASINTANFYQLVDAGFYDNKTVRVWRCVMPTKGDANTFGATPWFGGWIDDSSVERGKITLDVTSFLNVTDQQVPPNVIELTNTLASYAGARPPVGLSVIPQFDIIAGSTKTQLILRATSPTPGQVFSDHAFRTGFVIFNNGGTLDGQFSIVADSASITILGVHYNLLTLYGNIPWDPTPGVDTCYVSAPFPLNADEADYNGFDFVPQAESAL